MDIAAIEDLINQAMGAEGDNRIQAAQMVDQVRTAPDRWNVGLQLFLKARSELARFFGLSLVRDYLVSCQHGRNGFSEQNKLITRQIRESLWEWTANTVSRCEAIPTFILNNLVTVLTLLVKHGFPEEWATAFADVLGLGSSNTSGLDLAVRILAELEIEVVMFTEGRTKEEIAHNTIIKDALRATNLMKNIVEFLCTSAVSVRTHSTELSERCLRCLADLIGWIDVGLVISDSTLSTIYGSLSVPELCGAGCACLHELAKKGMDPLQKIKMLHAIGLVNMLNRVPIKGAQSDGAGPNRGGSGGGDDDEEGAEVELGPVVDVFFTELLGCWSKYEDMVFGPEPSSSSQKGDKAASASTAMAMTNAASNNGSASAGEGAASPEDLEALRSMAPTIAGLLHSIMPLLLALLGHPDTDVAATVVPALNRLIGVLKVQHQRKEKIEAAKEHTRSTQYFLAIDYLSQLLMGIYKQLQYDEDFGFDPTDDDDSEIIEAKKDIRKLYVNCCRVHPEPCLQLISAALSALPQPLSTAPWSPLEAALRLVYSFSECGPQYAQMVNESQFPSLIAAIHGTDVSSHPHPQVVLAYYDICVRYFKHADQISVRQFLSAMVDQRGLRHPNKQVRCRTAYFLFKTAEAMEGKASTMLSVVGSFADVILSDVILQQQQQQRGNFALVNTTEYLSEGAELHLLEAIGLISSSTYCEFEGPRTVENAERHEHLREMQRQQRQQLLEEMLRLLAGHIQALLAHPMLSRYADQFAGPIAHKISSLSSLAKGHSYKARRNNPEGAIDAARAFEATTEVVVAALMTLGGEATVRSKSIMYLHRMISCVGISSLSGIGRCALALLSQAKDSKDSEEVLQLLNQTMLEFKTQTLPVIDDCIMPVTSKCWSLYSAFEEMAASPGIEAPHAEAERVALQKHYLGFLQHVANSGCDAALYSPKNSQSLDTVFQHILSALQGGRGKISVQSSTPLRKAAVCILMGLVAAWMGTETPPPPAPKSRVPAGVEIYTSSSDDSDGENDQIASAKPPPPSPQLVAALDGFLREQALPTALRACTDGVSVDLRDAATQGLLGDLGGLLWSISVSAQGRGREALHGYLTSLLPALGWAPQTVQTLLQMVATPAPQGTFKENFKRFIRSAAA